MSRSLADAAFWLAVALCAVAQYFILRSTFVVRAAPADRQVPGARRPVEVLWAVLPAIALALVLWFTWRAMQPADAPPSGAPTSVASAAIPERQAPSAESSASHNEPR